MRARESSLLPRSPGSRRLYPISTHTASADESGNESRGGTEVNYQIDVRPQPTTSSPRLVKPTPSRHLDATKSSGSVEANREQLCRGYAIRVDDFFPDGETSPESSLAP